MVLPFEDQAIDGVLRWGGLKLCGLHEVAAASNAQGSEAAATAFVAGIAGRFGRMVRKTSVWVIRRELPFGPGLQRCGLDPADVFFAQASSDDEALAVMEDCLRDGSLGCVVGEVPKVDLTASRRLQLAAEAGQTPALVLKRWGRRGVCPLNELSGAVTRWRVAAAPSEPLPCPGIGRPRWRLDLARQRGGTGGSWTVEACDERGLPTVVSGVSEGAGAGGNRRVA
ncbi:protein ImuA (plasmid) [Sphingosinicella sp. BN140058]|nr:protein ImuA [Sphingosinicella sp. BN140058]